VKPTLILYLLLLSSTCSFSQANDVEKRRKQFNLTTSSLAISGFDPICYFTGSPKNGAKNLSYIYTGVTYYFSSAANRELFKKSTAKFEPAYGGWCAYAMVESGEKVEADPETYKIVEGKLYLFYNSFFNNTLPKWNMDEKNLKAKAERNWSKFYK